MAEVKYKFGADELDLLDYISNLEHNVQGYLNSKNWNEGLKAEFAEAYRKILSAYQDQLKTNSGRFSTDSLGWITDTLGEFSNKDNDNIDPVGSDYYYDNKGNQITTDDYNALKKRKQGNYAIFQANREVANFFNTVGRALAKARTSKTPSSNPFNLANHGFEKWWLDLNNPSGGDFDYAPYVDKDKADENGVRGTSERAKYLKELLENYLNSNLADYDYSNTPFKDKDTYILRLRAAIDNLANGYNSEDTIALQLAGLSSKFLNNFFATNAAATSTEDKAKLAEEEMKARLEKEQLEKVIALNELEKYVEANPFVASYSGYLDPNTNYDLKTIKDTLDRNYPQLEGDDKVKAYIEEIVPYLRDSVLPSNGKNYFTLEDYEEGMRTAASDMAQRLKFAIDNGIMQKYGDEYVIPGSENYDNYSVITYNPVTGKYQEQSVILNEKLREAMAYDMYKKNRENSKKVPSNAKGGLISYFQYGGLYNKLVRDINSLQELQKQLQLLKEDNIIKEKAEKTSKSEEQVKAGERKVFDGDLSSTDKARLAAIGLDLVSAISAFVPGYGTAASGITGVGSTLTTLGADIIEDGMQLSDFTNAGVGLGMDIVGMIPGFGTAGKAGKIGKALVKFAPYILGTLQARNALSESARTSWNKVIDGKFKELTVDDLQNLATGVAAITSGTTHAATRMKNAAMKSATKTGDKLIADKTGEMLRVTPEKLEAILKAKSLEEANNVLHSIPGYENKELASRFRSNWNPTRLWNHNPTVADHYDWSKLRNTTFNKGRFSDAAIFLAARSSNLGNFDWHLNIKNPYSKYLKLKSSTKPNQSVTTLQSSTKPKYNNARELSRKRFDKAVDKGIQTRDKIRTIEYWKKRYPKRFQGKTDDEVWQIIQELQLLSKKKQGGTLDLNKVRKFLNSGAITYTPTGKNGVRKKDSYTFDTSLRLQATLDRIKNGSMTVNDANQFLRRHYGMYSNWKQAPMTGGDINQYQTDYQGLGLNDAVIAPGFNNNYDILSSNPTSGDSLTKKWTIDGIYDQITDDRRVMARAADYEGRPEKLAADKAAAQAAGYEYYLDPDTQYYMLKPIVAPIDKGITEETPVTSEKTVMQTTQETSIDEPTAQPNNIFAKLFNNPTLTYGLPRALYADRMNRRITDMAKAAVTPLLKDPLEVNRFVRSDLDAEMQGERNYADLRNLASRPLTSDGSLQTAGLLEAELKGLDARTTGREKSNQTLRQYSELAWQLGKENATNRHETAMFNRALQWGAALDKAKMEQAYQSKKFNIWDTFGQLLEYDARVKLKENKALEDRFAQLDIHNETTNNLAKYAPDLSIEALNIWNQVVSGSTTPSQLLNDPAKWQLYQQALRALQYAETELLRLHYGISQSPYGRVRLQAEDYTVKIKSKRRGGKVDSKIAIAGIRAKTADAERFQKQIKACIDRNEKAIDRLSKSLYGIIKASILK